ncbi:MAG: alpha/beta fold hydrolase [Thermoanaerobaculia bacterium]
MSFSGHYWTLWPLLQRHLFPPPPAEEEKPWQVEFEDEDVGRIRLTGALTAGDHSALVVLVHGLGGSITSGYMSRAARTAAGLGLASLRLNLRGADGGCNDFYHAGLSSDLARVLESRALDRFERIYLLGFSLGGHLCLRFATEVRDPRVRAVAAVCSPLDLERSVAAFDRPSRWLYRRYVLASLVAMSTRIAMPTSLEELRRVRTVREWDRRTVVPRFGFADAGDYYRRASVAHRLDRLRRPALLVAARHDPLVPAASVTSALPGHDSLRVEWVDRGGHLGFPPDLDLGHGGPPGFQGQVLSWLVAR